MDLRACRRLAEEQLGGEEVELPSGVELQRVVHELRVHQLELEMQNEALREARTVAEAGWERFQDLFDSAPAGYFSVDGLGTILEVNQAGARLLGAADRSLLENQYLWQYLSGSDQPCFAAFLKRGLERLETPPCEVSLPSGTRVRLQGARSADGKVLQMVAQDVTELRTAQVRADQVHQDLLRRVDQLAAQLEAAHGELENIRRTLALRP
jgi:PAS domain S-box-containing protein